MNLEKLKDSARKFEQKEDWRRAIEVYLKAIQQIESGAETSPDLSLYNRVGDLYLKTNDTAAAVRSYERAVDLYADQGFFNNAIALCGKILRVNPGRTQTYLKLAQLHARKNVVIEAKRNLIEFLERMNALGQLDQAFTVGQGVRRPVLGEPGDPDDAGRAAPSILPRGRGPRAAREAGRRARGAATPARTLPAFRPSSTESAQPAAEPGPVPSPAWADLVFLDTGMDVPHGRPWRRPSRRWPRAEPGRRARCLPRRSRLDSTTTDDLIIEPTASKWTTRSRLRSRGLETLRSRPRVDRGRGQPAIWGWSRIRDRRVRRNAGGPGYGAGPVGLAPGDHRRGAVPLEEVVVPVELEPEPEPELGRPRSGRGCSTGTGAADDRGRVFDRAWPTSRARSSTTRMTPTSTGSSPRPCWQRGTSLARWRSSSWDSPRARRGRTGARPRGWRPADCPRAGHHPLPPEAGGAGLPERGSRAVARSVSVAGRRARHGRVPERRPSRCTAGYGSTTRRMCMPRLGAGGTHRTARSCAARARRAGACRSNTALRAPAAPRSARRAPSRCRRTRSFVDLGSMILDEDGPA